MVLCRRFICLDFPLYSAFLAQPCATMLSQCIHTAVTGFGHNGISSRNFLSHSASSAAVSKAINYDSIVERAIHVCLDDFHDTAAPPSVNTYPLVDLLSVLPEIQLASLYPSNTGGY